MLWLCLLLAAPVAASAGAWTLPRGELWTKVAFFRQKTDEWYLASPEFRDGGVQETGTRQPYRFGGRYASRAVFAEAVYGVTDRLDVGAQVPFFAQQYRDDTRLDSPSEVGIGDVRVFTKYRISSRPAVVSLKLATKAPVGDFRNEDGIIPVGEGQWDFDIVGQVGRSFWPLPLYANLDLGYRVRLKNEEVDRDPGDEWFFTAEAGVNLGSRLLLVTKLEGLRGEPSTDFGVIENRSQIRRITYLSPTLMIGLWDETAAELGVRYSLNGRNFPAGHQLVVGLSSTFGG